MDRISGNEDEMNEDEMPQRASEWLLALSEWPEDAALQTAFDDWLAASPDNRRDWQEINTTYELLGEAPPRHIEHWSAFTTRRERADADVVDFAIAGETSREKKPPKRRRTFATACAAIAASVILLAMPNLIDRLGADFATSTGEVRQVELADGSIVDLAPESLLKVTYTSDTRTVHLIEGTAYFDVVPDPKHPFRVLSDDVEVSVLGTAFEVRNRGEDIRIAVAEGTVRVGGTDQPRQAAILTTGQRIGLKTGGAASTGAVSPMAVAAWRHGELVAKDTPLAELVDELRLYHDGVIYLQGETLARQPLTGVYNLRNPLSALEAMAKAQGAHYHTLTSWITVIAGD